MIPRILVIAVWFCFGISLVAATSAPPRPLKRIDHPSTLLLEILPRPLTPTYSKRSFPLDSPILRHSDSLRLTLSAFGDTFHLHLRPNEHLIHPAARINYYKTAPDGRSVLSHTEPLLRESVMAYWGEVVHPEDTEARMREDAANVLPRPSGKSELGWARITVHHQGDTSKGLPPSFEGAFSANGIIHHIMTKDNYIRNKHHMDPKLLIIDDSDPDSTLVIFRDSDIMTPEEYHVASGGQGIAPAPGRTCGHDSLSFNRNPLENPALRKPHQGHWYDPFGMINAYSPNSSLIARDDVAGGGMTSNFQSNIGQTAGCPSTQKVVFMGVAADCEYTTQYGSSANASQQIISNFNTASALYKTTFNVSLGIVEMQVHDPTCPTTADASTPWNVGCSDSLTLNDRLSLFSDWRGKKGNDGAGLWHLMSGCPTGSEVGIAWLATLCQQTSSGQTGSIVSGTAVSTSGRVEWQVISHEIGHNFGAIHDCESGCESDDSQCCPMTTSSCNSNSQFIMSPVAQTSEMKFSQCTIGNICSLMTGNTGGKTNTSCLADPSSRTVISLQMCGNGIVEDGEDCDPGSGTTSPCCDSTTCKFKSGAVCDPDSSSCCTTQCSFAPTTQVCRPSKDSSCDTAEFCTGNSSSCPTDIFSPNGQSCGSNGLACANGVCTSLDEQCQTAGASMGLQKACPSQNDKTCLVSCQDPTTSNQCIQLQSQLIDGSPCGYGGTCQSGTCQTGSFLDTAKSWYVKNLQISIPVTIVAAIVAVLLLWALVSCIRNCTSSSRSRKDRQRLSSWGSGPVVATMGQVPTNAPPPYLYGPNVPNQGPPPIRQDRYPRPPNSTSWDQMNGNSGIPPSLYPGQRTSR
ncbi:Zinc metalloprotease [Abortiporus biennis]